MTRRVLLAAGSVLALVGAGWAVSVAQTASAQTPGKTEFRRIEQGPMTLNPGEWPEHWPYVDLYDAPVGAPEVHHVRYMDDKVRFVEVAYFPGVKGNMHGHPYASVFAVDAPSPANTNVRLDEGRFALFNQGGPPKGAEWPKCNTMGPEAPHAESGTGDFPHHFYRLEYKRLDGAAIKDKAAEWYPHLKDAPVTRAGAQPTDDGVIAAPNNYRLLWEDPKMRLVEVTLRPGEAEPMHADKYPAVLAMDATGAVLEDRLMDPSRPDNGQDRTDTAAPKGLTTPTCATVGARAPHSLRNTSDVTAHYYRIEFKSVDGDAIKTRWREIYPWMARYADAHLKNPPAPNY